MLQQYPDLHGVLPALGCSAQQCEELTQTIEDSDAQLVVDASPARLDRLLSLSVPIVRVRYHFRQVSGASLTERVERVLED